MRQARAAQRGNESSVRRDRFFPSTTRLGSTQVLFRKKRARNPGRKINVMTHSNAAPIAHQEPNRRMIPRSEAMSEAKPITVVSDVKKEGTSMGAKDFFQCVP